jgi:hypothetical protein
LLQRFAYTWKTMDLNACSVNAIHHLRCLLATVIAHSMGMKLNKVLIEDCGKWAEQIDH